MKLRQLFEAPIAGQPVFHATSLEFIKSILNSNVLRADTHHSESDIYPENKQKALNSTKTIQGVSLTRDRNFAEQWADVILVIDLNKIKQNMKVKQVAYFADDSQNNREESEEFVIGDIKNLDRYLIGLYFPKRLERQYLDWKWVQKNIKPVEQEFEGWKAVLESPKYIGQKMVNTAQKKAVGEGRINEAAIIDSVKFTGPFANTDFMNEALKGKLKKLNLPDGNLSEVAIAFYKNSPIGWVTKDGKAFVKEEWRGNGIAKMLKKQFTIISEQGRIVAGINTPPGITVDHTKKMAAALGFTVNRDGYPPTLMTNGKINRVAPKERDLSEDDEKSLFGHKPDLTYWTNGKTKDMVSNAK